ncbi:hypothetical protein RE476_09705 [Methanolobus mangrovi]|uniref:TIGR04206 family protein n=1 Tax=Methanolobus mangrovi TaxID=3072977 RepID=A0AA51UEI2_9EURY|nr:hypothetical protein [Methanolobus mangrovi]WMW21658.1 hypothetical protein RE476_09705 [Methanolobus mangrovi]
MQEIKINHSDTTLLRKIMPLICLAIPWEVYFYSNYSSGWGIKFSVFYANFDIIYGVIFVDLFQQMSLLSNGGFLPSVRTLGWVFGAILCIALTVYELSKANIEFELETKITAHMLIACGILTAISSVAVWNSTFKTLPIAPFFFIAFGYLLLKAEKEEKNTT